MHADVLIEDFSVLLLRDGASRLALDGLDVKVELGLGDRLTVDGGDDLALRRIQSGAGRGAGRGGASELT
jgi:hypothetical protein